MALKGNISQNAKFIKSIYKKLLKLNLIFKEYKYILYYTIEISQFRNRPERQYST